MMAATARPARSQGHHDELPESSASLRLVDTVSAAVTGASSASDVVTGAWVLGGCVGGGCVGGGAVAGGTVRGGRVRGGSVGGGSVGGGTVRGGNVRGGSVTDGSVTGGTDAGGTVAGASVGGPVGGGSVPRPGRVTPGGRVPDPPPDPEHDTARIVTTVASTPSRTKRIAQVWSIWRGDPTVRVSEGTARRAHPNRGASRIDAGVSQLPIGGWVPPTLRFRTICESWCEDAQLGGPQRCFDMVRRGSGRSRWSLRSASSP